MGVERKKSGVKQTLPLEVLHSGEEHPYGHHQEFLIFFGKYQGQL